MVKWRLHAHFEVDRYVPTRIDVTLNGGGEYGLLSHIAKLQTQEAVNPDRR